METPKHRPLHRAPLAVHLEIDRRVDVLEDPLRAWRGPRNAVLQRTETGWLLCFLNNGKSYRFRQKVVTVTTNAEDEIPASLWRHKENGRCWFLYWEIVEEEQPPMNVWEIKSAEDIEKAAWVIQYGWQTKPENGNPEAVCLSP